MTRAKSEVDPRYTDFVASIDAYWKFKNPGVPMTFDGSDGKAIKAMLKANYQLDLDLFRRCLNHRAHSPVNHANRIRNWIGNVLLFANGPCENEFGKPLRRGNGLEQLSRLDKGIQRQIVNRNVATAAIERAERRAAEEAADYDLLDADGHDVPRLS